MKKAIIIILVALSCQGFAQENSILEKPKVDTRVELLSIVFRLAERPEYSSTEFKLYTDRVDKHFKKYKNHKLIKYTKSIMYDAGISYDAPMSLAIYLDENLNKYPDITGGSMDDRWSKENLTQFVALLKQFYEDAKCDIFFKENADLYAEISKRFLPVYEHIDLKWYHTFFGKDPQETFIIINGLLIGENAYGPSVSRANEKTKVYAIMGPWSIDNTGMPAYKMSICFPALLHEFNHSFINYLTEKNKEAFQNSGEILFSIEKDLFIQQAYTNWETIINEALVRACVIQYMKDHNYDEVDIKQAIAEQIACGFLWIQELVDELENYDEQRNLYPTLENYMPELAEAYKSYAKTIQEFDQKRPKVVSIDEFINEATDIDVTLKTITINFDKPLSGKGYSFFTGEKGRDAFPKVDKVNYINDNKSVIMYVSLEKNKEYQFIVKGKSFMSVDGIPIKNYEVNFKTKKK